jgi:hypothetical protein
MGNYIPLNRRQSITWLICNSNGGENNFRAVTKADELKWIFLQEESAWQILR